MNARVCIVVPYFGKLPDYFPLWVKSCRTNVNFDWLLITDSDLPSCIDTPENLKVVRRSFEQFKKTIASVLDFEISLENPYKICDYRPVFGVALADLLKPYDYWGFCDLDIIWGNLSKHFPNEIFDGCDKIQENGHLTFCLNSDKVNNTFRLRTPNIDHRKILSSTKSFCFDEWGGFHDLAYTAGLKTRWVKNYFDADHTSFRLKNTNGINYQNQIIFWEDGILYREYIIENSWKRWENPEIARDEFSYIHLQKRKMQPMANDLIDTRGFYILPDGFMQKTKSEHCRQDFLDLNRDKVFFGLKKRFTKRARRTKTVIMNFARQFILS